MMAVIKSVIERKYSIKILTHLLSINPLIAGPKSAQGEIDKGQIIKAVIAITKIVKFMLPFSLKKPEATILEIVQALGLII